MDPLPKAGLIRGKQRENCDTDIQTGRSWEDGGRGGDWRDTLTSHGTP